jgi:hypothetical protein
VSHPSRRRLLRTATLVVAVSALLATVTLARAQVSWAFDTAGDTRGWQPLNDITSMQARDGALQLVMRSTDPYLWSGEQPLNLPAAESAWLEVRMRTDLWGMMQFYWVTAASPEWYGPDQKRLSGRVMGDGQWHTYRLRLNHHPAWTGTVTHLRLDPIEGFGPPREVRASIAAIRLLPADPDSVVINLSRPLPERGRVFRLYCRVCNDRTQPLRGARARLEAPAGLRLLGNGPERAVPTIAPGRGALVSWRLRADRAGSTRVTADVALDTGPPRQVSREFLVSEPIPRPTTDGPSRAAVTQTQCAVILANSRVRAVFVRNAFGYGRGEFSRYDARAGRWRPLARLRSLSRLVAGSRDCDQDLYAPGCETESSGPGGVALVFRTAATDGAGARWACLFRFALGDGDDTLRVCYQAVPDRATPLYRLDGPMLYVGEAAFGRRKDAAVFPGLEYLQGDQESSSLRDFTNDWRFRMAPHPYRVTVPAPSVTYQGSAVGLLWDPLHRWDDREAGMTAAFASPNAVTDFAAWDEAGDNHLVGVFVPSVPAYVPENHSLAEEPYPAAAGRPVTLETRLLLAAADDPTCAVRRWVDLYGLPAPAPSPRDPEVARDLCREAYLTTLWSPEQKAWKPYGEFQEYGPNAWVEMLLRLDALAAATPRARQALLQRVGEVAAQRPERPSGYDPTWTKVPYFLGAFDKQTLSWLEGDVKEALRTQQPDGCWRYVPLPLPEMFKSCPPLGDASLRSVYQTAAKAGQLLRWANLTGDRPALDAGLRALRFLAGGEALVPQGAPYEDPAASPYLLSSGLAVEAFVQGYRASGDRAYLDGARYWARSGLPFIYLWNLPGVPLQRYATIGVFGSSYYEHASWLGRPVQWIGLDYAYALRHLAPHDRSLPWAQIADGITVSALHQQADSGEYRGLYPDSVEGAGDFAEPGFKVSFGLWIQPDLIMINLLAGEGHDPDLRFSRTRVAGREVLLTSAADIISVGAVTHGAAGMDVRLRYFPGEAPCTVIAGYGRPEHVLRDGRLLPETPAGLGPVAEGWMYDAARRLVYLKTSFRQPAMAVTLTGGPNAPSQ